MHKILFLLFISTTVLANCRNTAPKIEKTIRDTTITIRNSFSELFLDSASLEKFILEQKADDSTASRLRNFYNSRNYQFAWFTSEGLAEQGRAFWNLHNNYINYSKDSSFVDNTLYKQMELLLVADTAINATSTEISNIEFKLTERFFQYAQFAYAGKIDPSELQWHIPRKKVDAASLLDSIVKNKGKNIENWEPVSNQYKLMKDQLSRYYEMEKSNAFTQIPIVKKTYKQGDSAAIIKQLKKRLKISGDYGENDTSAKFNKALTDAIKRAEKRFGFKEDGLMNAALIKALNVSLKDRIEQMLINMERMRWMPADPEGDRLVANIPEFKLHVYEKGNEVFSMNVVVGKAGNNTVVFNDQLKHIVFSPYWNVPESIVKNEILPGLRKNASYMTKRNMEQTGTANGLPVIRQRPGGSNSLGRVKFLFPNSYAIYFHDTPSKSLFNRESRAFSHGCIRLSQPKKLAEYLLRDRPEWTSGNIEEAMSSGKEKWVTLENPVPVVISYFTAWVDDEGLLNFRDDIYGHDKKMAERLFKR